MKSFGTFASEAQMDRGKAASEGVDGILCPEPGNMADSESMEEDKDDLEE